jgi:hypothetical protein
MPYFSSPSENWKRPPKFQYHPQNGNVPQSPKTTDGQTNYRGTDEVWDKKMR